MPSWETIRKDDTLLSYESGVRPHQLTLGYVEHRADPDSQLPWRGIVFGGSSTSYSNYVGMYFSTAEEAKTWVEVTVRMST